MATEATEDLLIAAASRSLQPAPASVERRNALEKLTEPHESGCGGRRHSLVSPVDRGIMRTAFDEVRGPPPSRAGATTPKWVTQRHQQGLEQTTETDPSQVLGNRQMTDRTPRCQRAAEPSDDIQSWRAGRRHTSRVGRSSTDCRLQQDAIGNKQQRRGEHTPQIVLIEMCVQQTERVSFVQPRARRFRP